MSEHQLSLGFRLKLLAQQARVFHVRAQTQAALLARTGDLEHAALGNALLKTRDACIDDWFAAIEDERARIIWPAYLAITSTK